MSDILRAEKQGPSRRAVASAAAWALPTIAIAVSAPAQASSEIPAQPAGLNGWIAFSWPQAGRGTYGIEGRPGQKHMYGRYGLWVTNTTSKSVIANTRIVVHYLPGPSSWSPSVSSSWSDLEPIGTHDFPEGRHESYQMTYLRTIVPTEGVTNLVSDMVFKGDVRVDGNKPSIYIDRYVTVDGVELAFRRKMGTNVYTPLNDNTPPNMPNTPRDQRAFSAPDEELEANVIPA
ncbi:hypothetical protein C5E07_14170 [Pseudoclavibacter sp. RFBJ3]|uniref:hypothetical protein n=1 Tax=unclassified Pseudoclavibacter TaxID=2615177 RepID=UPI000CE8B968|nr:MULTISPECIES: hypothetical protein [unclassified Pseudoclavibacter]PPF81423.1 hypothetical protein C5C12_13910 [Pseudoclavibacter sp. RFBJ5]PPF90754.1 hypothetical protein C5E07_14170 [Pseudoclavibacter sp. RFBJ3]PPG00615.1 hypothetical protein C5C19_01560 [Pseudoclavibacter sp. RFBH5]PPG21050.1 hypothetical protein C5E13_14115 [Pseudoclavibacter sp. RFBI4]